MANYSRKKLSQGMSVTDGQTNRWQPWQ